MKQTLYFLLLLTICACAENPVSNDNETVRKTLYQGSIVVLGYEDGKELSIRYDSSKVLPVPEPTPEGQELRRYYFSTPNYWGDMISDWYDPTDWRLYKNISFWDTYYRDIRVVNHYANKIVIEY